MNKQKIKQYIKQLKDGLAVDYVFEESELIAILEEALSHDNAVQELETFYQDIQRITGCLGEYDNTFDVCKSFCDFKVICKRRTP